MIGAASGLLITWLFQSLGSEISTRLLGPRERGRVGAAYTFALAKIQKFGQKGILLRDDDFFEKENEDRLPSEEIREGIILSAQRAYEEKKIKF